MADYFPVSWGFGLSDENGQRPEVPVKRLLVGHSPSEVVSRDAADDVDASRAITSLRLGVASWYRADGELPEAEFLNRYRSIAQSIVGVR